MERKPVIELEGKVALITGGSRGIGEAMARAFGLSGAKVAIVSRKQEGVDEALGRLRAAGIDAVGFACHTGKEADVQAAVRRTVEAFGGLDVVVANAATNPYFGPLMTADERAFDKTFEVNVKGYFYTAREGARVMIERGKGGSIILVSSINGLRGAPLQGIYGMTKSAVNSMAETLAVELGASNIRVNALAPGLVETRFSSALTSNRDIVDRVVGRTPLGRYAKPEELAGAALFLASDAASFMTGQTMVVDGGWTIG